MDHPQSLLTRFHEFIVSLGFELTPHEYWGAILICFLFSCFFALVETTLTSLSPTQAQKIVESKRWFAASIREWIEHPNRILATILIADTMMDTAVAVIFASFMGKYYPEVNIAIVTALLGFVVLIFGEIAPKMVARAYAVKLAPITCQIMVIIAVVLRPLTYLITAGITNFLRLFGIKTKPVTSIHSSDIEYMVMLAGREGSLEGDKRKILSSVFSFTKRRVRDIMIPRDKIVSMSVNSSLSEVLDIIRHEHHSRYPVFSESLDRVVGFLHVRDLFGFLRSMALSQTTQTISVEHFSLRTCLRRAFFVSEQAMISRVLNEMKTNRTHLAIVKDEWGNVVGLVSLEDIVEEVFGEIEDEHDEHVAGSVPDLFSIGVEVEGSEGLADMKAKYNVDIEPTDSYSTLNGFLQHYTSHQQLVPNMVIIWNNYVFTILSVKDGEIEKVRITEVPEHEAEKE